MWPAKLKVLSRRMTVGLLVGVAALLIVWDIFASPTESAILAYWSRSYMALPWTLGMLVGHWVWNWRTKPPDTVIWKIVLNFSILALLIAWDVASHYGHPLVERMRHAEYWAPIGFLCGHFLWGQGE